MKSKFSGKVQISTCDHAQFFSAPIETDASYAGNLEQASANQENSADAFVFLAALAARHLDPHHFHGLRPSEEMQWKRYFRPQTKM